MKHAWIKYFYVIAAVAELSRAASPSAPQTRHLMLEDFLKEGIRETEKIKELDISSESLDAEIAAREIELASTVDFEASYLNLGKADFSGDAPKISQPWSLTWNKPFATGTRFSVLGQYENLSTNANTAHQNRWDWELSLTQSLWRNAFGRATQFRRRADLAELKSRQYELLRQRQQHIVDLEAAYWDLALGYKEQQILDANFKRSEEIERWVKRRARQSAAENTDVFQAASLVSQRRLDLILVQNNLKKSWSQLRSYLPSLEPGQWVPELSLMGAERSLDQLRVRQGQGSEAAQSLATLADHYRAELSQVQSEGVADQWRPRLELELGYGQNGIDPSSSVAFREAGRADHREGRLTLRFSTPLDFSLQRKKIQVAQLNSEAVSLAAQQSARASQLGWVDLQRDVENLKARFREAESLASLQRKTSEEERQRYRMGRTTAFQAITFEVAAANSELLVYRLLAELRKMESSARLFE